jgi:transposase
VTCVIPGESIGGMDRESLEWMLGRGLSLAEIGRRLQRHESTVAYWVAKHGLEAAGSAKHASRGGLERAQLEKLVEAGMSIAEISAAVGLSKGTVRHWLKRYEMTTRGTAALLRSAESAAAREAGLPRTKMVCRRHGRSEFALEGRGYYRCVSCRSDSVSRRRRNLKLTLVQEAGGACKLCGYSRCLAALEFHHVEPGEKSFGISGEGVTRSLAKAREEARKCVLLCATCHAEVEAGYAELPGEEIARVQCA